MTENPRRKYRRKQLHSPISPLLRWRGRSGEFDACIKDVSIEGCFLNTQGEVEIGEIVSFKTSLPTDELVEIRGRVVHKQTRPIGFGLRFEDLTEREVVYLRLLMADADGNAL